jgi:threonine dehydrogenase-like Zn-dependent dehydrogenase
LLVPQSALYPLPKTVTEEMGALVEPGANAYRAVAASGVQPGWRVLVIGPGTIGLLCAQFALAAGCEVHVLGHSERSLERARRFGVKDAWIQGELPPLAWDAVIDASDEPPIPQQAVDLVEPGRRVVFIGISEDPSYIDSRMVALKDLTAVGILGGSLGLGATIDAYASGSVDPVPFIGAKVPLEDVAVALEGRVLVPDGAGPKILVDPRL